MTYYFNNFNFRNFGAINADFRGSLHSDADIVLSCAVADIGVAADVLGSNEDILHAEKVDDIGSMTLVKAAWGFVTKTHGYGDYSRSRILQALQEGDSVTLFSR